MGAFSPATISRSGLFDFGDWGRRGVVFPPLTFFLQLENGVSGRVWKSLWPTHRLQKSRSEQDDETGGGSVLVTVRPLSWGLSPRQT